jgi:coproporphyrinogen III oxidase
MACVYVHLLTPPRQLQICKAVEDCDGGAKFQSDAWVRADGGGGISMVLRDGKVS